MKEMRKKPHSDLGRGFPSKGIKTGGGTNLGCKGRVKRTVWMERSEQGRVEMVVTQGQKSR